MKFLIGCDKPWDRSFWSQKFGCYRMMGPVFSFFSVSFSLFFSFPMGMEATLGHTITRYVSIEKIIQYTYGVLCTPYCSQQIGRKIPVVFTSYKSKFLNQERGRLHHSISGRRIDLILILINTSIISTGLIIHS